MNLPGNFHFFIFFYLDHLHWVGISFIIMEKTISILKKEKKKIYKQHEIKFHKKKKTSENVHACDLVISLLESVLRK